MNAMGVRDQMRYHLQQPESQPQLLCRKPKHLWPDEQLGAQSQAGAAGAQAGAGAAQLVLQSQLERWHKECSLPPSLWPHDGAHAGCSHDVQAGAAQQSRE
jgi:hypothetical protein